MDHWLVFATNKVVLALRYKQTLKEVHNCIESTRFLIGW